MYNNIKDGKCQEEIKKEFLVRKKDNILLSESYERVLYDDKKYLRVRDCGTFLEFAKTDKSDFKLHNANFCRDRLCPVCSWRRSLKVFSQVSKIMDVIEHDYRFLFLTLTVLNCSGSELDKKIDDMQKNFREIFCKNKKFKSAVKGFFRSLEITHDTDERITFKKYRKAKGYYDRKCLKVGDDNPNYDMYHPHFHLILAVDRSYFNSRSKTYITQDEWLDMWRYAMNDYSIVAVDVRVCKDKKLSKQELKAYKNVKSMSSAVCEVAKYTVKSNDYIVHDDVALTDSTVKTLFYAMKNRRLCGLGGCFKKVWQQVRGAEKELGDGDLVDINGNLRQDVFIQLYRYRWTNGCYKLFEVEDVESKEVSDIIEWNDKRYVLSSFEVKCIDAK